MPRVRGRGDNPSAPCRYGPKGASCCTKRAPDQLAPIYDLYVGKDAILSRDGAVVVADVDKVIAQMAENGAIPKGAVVSPDLYRLPKEFGGLSR
jgi:hypothetical protein